MQAREIYEGKETEELIGIAFVDNDDYREEAIELAREVLEGRGIDSETHDQVQHVRRVVAKAEALAPVKGGEPLPPAVKALCLVMPVVGAVIAITKRISGNKRASLDAWGMVFYGVMVGLVVRLIWTVL